MDKFLTEFDDFSYKALVQIIGVVSLICYVFVWWVAILWSLGSFIRFEFIEGFVALGVCILSAIVARGGGILLEKTKES